ncbi:MAG: hypothetical protein HYS43_00640 [Candidatus Liptonbacteria bacterium]|nr:hypothetical protein [Candidatus Liptonbacteria bacterium]
MNEQATRELAGFPELRRFIEEHCSSPLKMPEGMKRQPIKTIRPPRKSAPPAK